MPNYIVQFYHQNITHFKWYITKYEDKRLKAELMCKLIIIQNIKKTQHTSNINIIFLEQQLRTTLKNEPLIYCWTYFSIFNRLAHHFANIICHWQQSVFFVTPVSFLLDLLFLLRESTKEEFFIVTPTLGLLWIITIS